MKNSNETIISKIDLLIKCDEELSEYREKKLGHLNFHKYLL